METICVGPFYLHSLISGRSGEIEDEKRSMRPYKREIDLANKLGPLSTYNDLRCLSAAVRLGCRRPPTHDFHIHVHTQYKCSGFSFGCWLLALGYLCTYNLHWLSFQKTAHSFPSSFSFTCSLSASPSVNPYKFCIFLGEEVLYSVFVSTDTIFDLDGGLILCIFKEKRSWSGAKITEKNEKSDSGSIHCSYSISLWSSSSST